MVTKSKSYNAIDAIDTLIESAIYDSFQEMQDLVQTNVRSAVKAEISDIFSSMMGLSFSSPAKKVEARKPGRPKKAAAAAPVAKRSPGRPKKVVEEAAAPKRGPGRPKKTVEAVAVEATKRRPGRPKKVAEEAPVAKRGPGRPKKVVEASSAEVVVKRRPGRPKKDALPVTTAPFAMSAKDSLIPANRRPGRPKKVPSLAEQAAATTPPANGSSVSGLTDLTSRIEKQAEA